MRKLLVCALAALCFGAPADAHHSAGVKYDLTQETAVSGVVTSVVLRNPHVRLYLTVTGADGAEAEWLAEGGTYSALERVGWGGERIRPGQAVVIHGRPSRDGSNTVYMQTVTLPDGSVVNVDEPMPTGGLEAVRARRRSGSD